MLTNQSVNKITLLDPRKRTRLKADRPAELLEAALDSVRVNGVAVTRMDDIAARVGVSKGTIYLYFPSRQALFEALAHAKILPNIERIEALTADPTESPSAQLRRIRFQTPMLGAPWLLAIGLVVFIIANLAVGFLFSTVAANQLQAMQTSFFFLPSILMSGFMFPFRGMPSGAHLSSARWLLGVAYRLLTTRCSA